MYPGGSVPLGEVLARQAVGVLVGAALPGAAGVAEVHLHAGRGGHACMQGEFGSPVPCRAVAQQRGQRPHLADDGVLHVFGVVPVGQVQEDREPGGAFHEGAGRAAVAGTADQVALPVAGDRPVGDLGRPVAGHGHGLAEPGASGLAVAAVPAGDVPPSHGMFELESQLSLALHVDGLVDGLVACVRASVIRVAASEPAAGLFGAPVLAGSGLGLVPQSCAGHGLAWLGASGAVGGLLLGAVRPVRAADVVGVAAQFAADGAGRPAEGPGDGSDAAAGAAHVGDGDALVHAQVSGVDLRGLVHAATVPVHERPFVAAGGTCPAVAPGLPVRLDTPTARAAWARFMPPRTRSRYFARRAACMSRGFPCLVPSNSCTMFRFLPNPRCCDVH